MTKLALTDEDHEAIECAYDAAFNPLDRGAAQECEAIYRAGLRAGIEEAAKVCDAAAQGYEAEAKNQDNAYGEKLMERRIASIADAASIRRLIPKEGGGT